MPRVSLLSLILVWSTCGVCTRVAHDGDACPHERTPRTRRRRSPRAILRDVFRLLRRGPPLSFSLSFFLSRFSRGAAHPSVHHPGCRRVTAPPERYALRLHRRTPRQHKYREIKALPPARPPIAAVATPFTFMASLKIVQVLELKFSCDNYE